MPYASPSARRLERADRILRSGLPTDVRSDLTYGRSIHDVGINDEEKYRSELRGRRAMSGALAGSVLGAGVGGRFGGASPGKRAMIGAVLGAGVGGLAGVATVARGKEPYYMNDVQRVRDLVKQHRFPKLTDDEREILMQRQAYAELDTQN
jgi:hypothetical protein